jgi:hypothetical protein
MVRSRPTACKSIGRQPIGQIASRDVPPQQEPKHDSPQYVPQEDDPFKIVVKVPMGEESQESAAEAQ